MTTPHSGENLLGRQTGLAPVSWDWQLARWVTQVGSPPVTATGGLVLIGWALPANSSWGWILFYGLLTVMIPSLYVLWLFQKGLVSDLHLRDRTQRTRPTLITLAAVVAGWSLLYAGAAPAVLIALAGATAIQTVLFFMITLRWKISAHTGAAATLAVLAAWSFVNIAAMPIILSVPLIAWSRVRLGDHTPAQTVAGVLLSSSVLALFLLIQGG